MKGAYKHMEILDSIAEMIDHSFLHLSLTDEGFKTVCAPGRGFKP